MTAYRSRLLALTAAAFLTASSLAQSPVPISIDAKSPTTPFPHFWEQTFGSGRAILSLRESYRDDIRTVKAATDFKAVRFHGILMDEVGLYDPDRTTIAFAQMTKDGTVLPGSPYNFSYIDQIYDGLLALHVRPFVELSFMPKKLASDPNSIHPFWYHPNTSPPSDYVKWDAMITALTRHLVDRYGLDEVSQWNFEVWNEPNLDFWGGSPKQVTYFTLYDHTARAIKSVSTRLKVGGPATAQAAWVAPFLKHTHDENVPVDFVSTHVYANDTADNVLGTDENLPRNIMVFRAVEKVHREIKASAYPDIPLYFSEYNASYANEPNVTDSDYMGPWMANNIRQCDGLTQEMDYWAFSDVFEEQGVVRSPFYGGFGLMAADNIPKPALNVFAALHKLGDHRIAVDSDSALATTSPKGLSIALWNYAPPTGTGPTYTMPTTPAGPAKTFTLDIKNAPTSSITIWRIDEDHSNVLKAFDAMGRPAGSLTQDQIAKLKAAGQMSPPEHLRLKNGKLEITVPAHGLAVLTLER